MARTITIELIEDAWEPGSMTIEIDLGKIPRAEAEQILAKVRESFSPTVEADTTDKQKGQDNE